MKIWCALLLFFLPCFLFFQSHLGDYSLAIVNHSIVEANPTGIALTPNREMTTKFLTGGAYAV